MAEDVKKKALIRTIVEALKDSGKEFGDVNMVAVTSHDKWKKSPYKGETRIGGPTLGRVKDEVYGRIPPALPENTLLIISLLTEHFGGSIEALETELQALKDKNATPSKILKMASNHYFKEQLRELKKPAATTEKEDEGDLWSELAVEAGENEK